MASRQRNRKIPSQGSSTSKAEQRNLRARPVSQVEKSSQTEPKDWSANQTSITEGGSSED